MGGSGMVGRLALGVGVIGLGFGVGMVWLPGAPPAAARPAVTASGPPPVGASPTADTPAEATPTALANRARIDPGPEQPPATATRLPDVSPSPSARPAAATVDHRPGATPTPRSGGATPAATPAAPRATATGGAPHATAPGEPVSVPAEVNRVRTRRPVVALTFDAGGDAGSTAQTLRVLRERSVRATFFVTGRFAEQFPTLVREMVIDGHEIANHTYDHKDLQHLSNAQIAAELEKTEAILRGFTGRTTKPLMRAPFGSRDARVRAVAGAAGYRSIYWAIDSGDWKPGATPAGVAATLRKAAAGDIVVEHSSTNATATALPGILNDLSRRGLTAVTVSTLLAG